MTLKQKYKFAESVTVITYSLLLLSFCAWQLTRPQGPSYFFWLVQTIPLLIFIPGMRAKHFRTYSWMCFVILAYFVKGVEGVMLPPVAWIDYVILSASIILFISAMFTSRWMQSYQVASHQQIVETH